jgi:hypothetical protein
MKKIKFEKKIALKKETITRLTKVDMQHVLGGEPNTVYCPTWNCPTTKTATAPSGPANNFTRTC